MQCVERHKNAQFSNACDLSHIQNCTVVPIYPCETPRHCKRVGPLFRPIVGGSLRTLKRSGPFLRDVMGKQPSVSDIRSRAHENQGVDKRRHIASLHHFATTPENSGRANRGLKALPGTVISILMHG